MNNEELKKRILKGVEYFYKLKPSELDYLEKSHWTTFLKLLKVYFSGEDIIVKDLKDTPKDIVSEARELFNTK